MAPPYTEDFESEATCALTCNGTCSLITTGWTNAVGDNVDWLVDVGGTTSSLTGPSTDHNPGTSTGKYLYLETSVPCDAAANVANLVSPPLDLNGVTAPGARIWYHLYGATIGSLHIDVLDAAQAVLQTDVIPAVVGDQGDNWFQTPVIDLAPFVGNGTIHVRVRGIHSGSGFTGDMAVDDFEFKDYSATDLGITSLVSPISGCALSASSPVTVTLQNFALVSASGFNVQYVLNAGAAVVEPFVGTIGAGGAASFTFATLADLSAPMTHTLDVTVVAAGDVNPANDTFAAQVISGATVAGAYFQDFEGANDWVAGGANSSWALGMPAGSVILGAASGVNAWMTGLAVNYNNSEQSFVAPTACFDFSAMVNPAVSMSVWWNSEFSWDGAVLQSSIDGGSSWQNVGAFGDPGWYNDTTINGAPGGSMEGWTGNTANGSGSNGWVTVVHNLDGMAGNAGVKLRIAFGTDTSVNSYDGFAFDDVSLFDNIVNSASVANSSVPISSGFALPAGALNVPVQAIALTGYGLGPHILQSITVQNQGTILDADVTAVRLWLDNGDGIFNAALDTLADTQTLSGGLATLNGNGLIAIGSFLTETLFVTYDVGPAPALGSTIWSGIGTPSMDITFVGSVPVSTNSPAIEGSVIPVGGADSSIPYFDDYSGTPFNRSAVFAAGNVFPTATGVGTGVTLGAPTTNGSLVEVLPSYSTLFPAQGTAFGAISFPNSTATGAIDYHFDLSALTVAKPLWLSFVYTDNSEEDNAEDQVFVSLNGGATWLGSIYDFDWTLGNIASGWIEHTLDLSAMVASFGGTYTSDVVIRFQVSDNSSLPGGDGFLLDRVALLRPMELSVERIAGMPIPTGSIDDLGSLEVVPQSASYALNNIGDVPLTIDLFSFAAFNIVNATNIGVVTPVNPQVDPQMSANLQVDLQPGIGPFSFDLVFGADDPSLMGTGYALTITGIGIPADCSNPAAVDGTICDDGDACTQTDACLAGVCVGTNPVTCLATDQCNMGACDPMTGTCSTPPLVDGTACDDGDLCTQDDTCQAGVCVGDNPIVCTALDQCHVAGVCDPTTGVCDDPEEVDATACDDGDLCTQDDTCQAGVCVGDNPVVCVALDECHLIGVCDSATGTCDDPAVADGVLCDDGDACTQSDTCQAGVCVGDDPVVCAALDACHDVGTCDSATGVCDDPTLADGAVCDGGTCQSGKCTPDETTGAGGGGGSGETTSSSASGAGASDAGPGDETGCSCRAPGGSDDGNNSGGAFALAMLGLVAVRRRPRASR